MTKIETYDLEKLINEGKKTLIQSGDAIALFSIDPHFIGEGVIIPRVKVGYEKLVQMQGQTTPFHDLALKFHENYINKFRINPSFLEDLYVEFKYTPGLHQDIRSKLSFYLKDKEEKQKIGSNPTGYMTRIGSHNQQPALFYIPIL